MLWLIFPGAEWPAGGSEMAKQAQANFESRENFNVSIFAQM